MKLRRFSSGMLAAILILFISACSPAASGPTESDDPSTATVRETSATSADPTAASSAVTTSPPVLTITLSFVGDCILGTDPAYKTGSRFPDIFDRQGGDSGYFFRNVESVFSADDLTVANLECVLTDETEKQDKRYNYKGDPSYASILSAGSVEAVSVANNHIFDFLDKGYLDTQNALKSAGISYFGYENYLVCDLRGITVGLAAFNLHDISSEEAALVDDNLTKAMQYFEEQDVDIRVVSFHWSIEREYQYDSNQEAMAHSAIDQGADLVVGHHPHVLQGIDQYKGATIAYSLGNFCYGGDHHIDDMDSVILQGLFTFTGNEMTDSSISLIPVSISSVKSSNNFQPVILEGDDAQRVIDKINGLSRNYQYSEP